MQALATLVRLLRDVDLAEDALQEACTRAVPAWRTGGVPDNPAGWLVRAARNHAYDRHRHRAMEARNADSVREAMAGSDESWREVEDGALEPVKDDVARLVFTCCHPLLSDADQVALTLHTVGGLSTAEVAAAFLVEPRAMEQRLTRVKRRIQSLDIGYEPPSEAELPERLESALLVAYLVFNEGYRPASGDDASRPALARVAIRLGRVLLDHFPSEPEVMGLLSLMLLQHARGEARVDEVGDLVPLSGQDVDRWDPVMIAEGRALLEKALRHRVPGAYQIQAAIAEVHCRSSRPTRAQWAEIAGLYRMLERHMPSPVVTLNRAVAEAESAGPDAGLAVLESIGERKEMARYHRFHAVRGELLGRVGRRTEAEKALERARSLAGNQVERRFLTRRIGELL